MTFWLDVKEATRRLIRTPLFTAAVVSTLGAGLAVAMLTFAIVDGVWLRPLPFTDPDGLVSISPYSISPADLLALENERATFAGVAGYSLSFPALVLPGDEPLVIRQAIITPNFLELLGVRPLLGAARLSDPAAGTPEVYLTHRLWMQRFGGDPAVVGSQIAFEDRSRRVAGVLPADFLFLTTIQELMPDVLATPVEPLQGRALRAIGRLAGGVTTAQASAVVDRDAPPRLPPNALVMQRRDPPVQSLSATFVGDYVTNIMRLLIGGVGILLLIASANLTHMLIARGSGRAREVAVRRALGARRFELVRLIMLEGLLLAIAGGFVAALLSVWTFRFVQALIPNVLPRSGFISIDGRVLAGGLMFTLFVGVLSSLLPAIRLSRPGTADLLQRGGRGGASGRARLGKILIALEAGLAVVLVAGGSLMLTSFVRLMRSDIGFRPGGVLQVNVRSPTALRDLASREYVRAVRDRVRSLPFVQSVGLADMRPIARASRGEDLHGEGSPKDKVSADWRTVSPDYFRTLGIRVVAGREFVPADETAAVEPALLSASLARRLWPEGELIGRRFQAIDLKIDCEVIGVVADVRSFAVRSQPVDMLYLSTDRRAPGNFYLSIRIDDERQLSAVADPIAKEIRTVDARGAIRSIQPLDALVGDSVADTRMEAALFGVFGALAFAVAIAGVAGVTAYSVTQRTQEFGIRLALGLAPRRLAARVVLESLWPAVVGSAAGFGAALWLARLLRGLVFGIAPDDPATLVAVVSALVIATIVASYVPARRASRLDPTRALRAE
ncbi:MAG TPA: FtsX-like permease family protein [Vicinamibacterales bacterium]|nr:FtsX-like permease family protein [Vicinamibacterales bacterium]